MRSKTYLFLFVLLAASLPAFAGGFGLQVNWNKFDTEENGLEFDTDDSDFGIGARAELGGDLHLILSFDYYFAGDVKGLLPDPVDTKFYEVNGNLAYTFSTVAVRPYVGAGIGVARRTFESNLGDFFEDSQSELGFNLLGGVRLEAPVVSPFIEFRYVIYGGDETFNNRYVLTGGILF